MALTQQQIEAVNIIAASITDADLVSLAWADLTALSPEGLVAYRRMLGALYSRASVDGGRITMQKAAPYIASFAQAGGAARYDATATELQRRGLWQFWIEYEAMLPRVSFWAAVVQPVLQSAAVMAAMYAGVSALASVGAGGAAGAATTGEALTVADTYAAMNAAAGITTSGSIAADVALASAVQTGSMTAAAANAYSAAILAGTVSEAAVVEGLATSYGIGTSTASAAGAALTGQSTQGAGTMATTTTTPSGMDAVFDAMGNAAQQVIGAYTKAAVNNIATNQQSANPLAQGGTLPPPQNDKMIYVAVGVGVLALLAAALIARA